MPLTYPAYPEHQLRTTWYFAICLVFLQLHIVFVDLVWNVPSVARDNVLESLAFEHCFYLWEVTIKLYLFVIGVIYSVMDVMEILAKGKKVVPVGFEPTSA